MPHETRVAAGRGLGSSQRTIGVPLDEELEELELEDELDEELDEELEELDAELEELDEELEELDEEDVELWPPHAVMATDTSNTIAPFRLR